MGNIKKWLDKNNFKFNELRTTEGKNVIEIKHNYIGYYPTADVIKESYKIREHMYKYYKNIVTAEERGSYTATWIIEK